MKTWRLQCSVGSYKLGWSSRIFQSLCWLFSIQLSQLINHTLLPLRSCCLWLRQSLSVVASSCLCCWMIFLSALSSSCCCFWRNSCSWRKDRWWLEKEHLRKTPAERHCTTEAHCQREGITSTETVSKVAIMGSAEWMGLATIIAWWTRQWTVFLPLSHINPAHLAQLVLSNRRSVFSYFYG